MPNEYIQVGQRLTNYAGFDITVQRVARGGMGLVAFGPDHFHGNLMTALKTVLPDRLGRSPRLRQLFVREALTWVGLWPHPNLLTAKTVIVIQGVPFLVLDYAEQGSLRDVLRSSQPLATRFAWAQHIAAGLLALHTPDPAFLRPHPLVHRDLKPENVLIMSDRTPFADMLAQLLTGVGNVERTDGGVVAFRNQQYATITDFGLAKVVAEAEIEIGDVTLAEDPHSEPTHSQMYRTAHGVALGTFAYMPPEQWEDAANVGSPADIYAFGLILSELLTGRLGIEPERGMGVEAWREAHRRQTPHSLQEVVPMLPRALENLYLACLAKDPGGRPTAAEALATLQQVAPAMGGSTYTPREILPHTPDNEMMKWDNLAMTYAQFGMYEEALERNTRALALVPHNNIALSTRSTILMKLGRLEEGLVAIDAAITETPKDDTRRRGVAISNKGVLLSRLGKYDDAERAFVQALTFKPDDVVILYGRANNLVQWSIADAKAKRVRPAREHVRMGIQCAEQALRLDPSQEGIRSLLLDLQRLSALLGR